MVKNLPAVGETWVLSLGQEDPLEKEMATHSSILDWRIPWMEEPGRAHGVTKSWTQKSCVGHPWILYHKIILVNHCTILDFLIFLSRK